MGERVKIGDKVKVGGVRVGVMIGKGVKVGEGEVDRDRKKVRMKKELIEEIGEGRGWKEDVLRGMGNMNVGGEVWDIMGGEKVERLWKVVREDWKEWWGGVVGDGEVRILLMREEGKIYV